MVEIHRFLCHRGPRYEVSVGWRAHASGTDPVSLLLDGGEESYSALVTSSWSWKNTEETVAVLPAAV